MPDETIHEAAPLAGRRVIPLDDLEHTRLGDDEVVVTRGHVVVSPSGVAHGFSNTGTGELRLTAIHGAGRFDTEWLEGDDPVWTTRPRPPVD